MPNSQSPITNSPITNHPSPITLHALPPGSCATIVRVGGAGALRRRCAEMGLVRGELIRTERVAPLGDPIAYRVKGYTLSLRREDAALIEVLPVHCHEAGTPCATEDAARCPLDEATAPLPGGVQAISLDRRAAAPLPEEEDESRAHG